MSDREFRYNVVGLLWLVLAASIGEGWAQAVCGGIGPGVPLLVMVSLYFYRPRWFWHWLCDPRAE